MIVDIRQNIDREIFKSSYQDENDWPAGWFDYQLDLEDVDDETIFHICEWLAENCNKNFVCVRKTSELIAGGSTNNLSKWNRRKERGRDKFDREQISLMVRLEMSDTIAFRMAWVL